MSGIANVTDSDISVPGGRLRLRRHGAVGPGPLVLCVPGLSANAASFDFLGERLAARGRSVVSLDLRGRGFSEATAPGSYGWEAHARDVLAVAADLCPDGAVDLVGHSMGAYVVMAACGAQPAAVRRAVLVDGLGVPEPAAMPPILQAVARLDTVRPSVEDYVARVRGLGTIVPWSDYWERYFRYELSDVDGGVLARTDREAVLEDVRFIDAHDQRELWPGLRCPTLLVRATRPLGEQGGFIVSAADRDRYLATVPGARCVEVDANHYTVVTDANTAAAVAAFLDG